jgi:hypothetical protein
MAPSTSSLLNLSACAMALGGISLLFSSTLIVVESQADGADVAARSDSAAEPPCHLECSIPEGLSLSELSTAVADQVAQHTLLCADLACGRIDQGAYQTALDNLTRPPPAPLPEHLWASEVTSFSSEYTSSSWSAAQVLGAPDTYPRSGDNTTAWASATADGQTEFIELAFPAHRASAVDVYETFNAGAIRSIDIRLESGIERRVFAGQPRVLASAARIQEASFSCTDEKVVGVRVTLDTSAVEGWNEIDAVGLRPCR